MTHIAYAVSPTEDNAIVHDVYRTPDGLLVQSYPLGARHLAKQDGLAPIAARTLTIRPAATAEERAVLLSNIPAERIYTQDTPQ
jgi:hypothetical protein